MGIFRMSSNFCYSVIWKSSLSEINDEMRFILSTINMTVIVTTNMKNKLVE